MKISALALASRFKSGDLPTEEEIRREAGAGMRKVQALLRNLEAPPVAPTTKPSN